ncbi:MAG: metallophosphoesterase [Phycisphaerales bacterium]
MTRAGPTPEGGAAPAAGGADGPRVRIAAVADLHAHKGHHGEFRPLVTELEGKADVLLLPGDLTNLGLPEEAETLAADLASLRIPILAVLGNHDHHSGKAEEVKRALAVKANVTFLEDETFEFGGVGFAGVKGFGGGFGAHMLSAFGEEATKHFVSEAISETIALENALKTLTTPRVVVAMHYSPIAETVAGEPAEVAPFLGCSRFAEAIDRHDIAAVFHGHAHHGSPRGQTGKGIPVYNCSLALLRHRAMPPYVIVEV